MSNEAKFTKGPWVAIYPEQRIDHNGTDITRYEIMSEKTRGELKDSGILNYRDDPHHVDNITIADAYWRDMADEEAKANASLIAAAPEMYEFIFSLQLDSVSDEIARDKLLAKARGEIK